MRLPQRANETVEVRIGDKPEDPVFVITDLLPHLASEQMTKKATEVVRGEGLNVLVGSVPSGTVDEKCGREDQTCGHGIPE